jgi:hypothetical protein
LPALIGTSSRHGRTAIDSWERRLGGFFADTAYVFAYLNNDGHRCAPRDAHLFAGAFLRVGLSLSRVPLAREMPFTTG